MAEKTRVLAVSLARRLLSSRHPSYKGGIAIVCRFTLPDCVEWHVIPGSWNRTPSPNWTTTDIIEADGASWNGSRLLPVTFRCRRLI